MIKVPAHALQPGGGKQMSMTNELERFKKSYSYVLSELDRKSIDLVEKAFEAGYMTGHKTGYEIWENNND